MTEDSGFPSNQNLKVPVCTAQIYLIRFFELHALACAQSLCLLAAAEDENESDENYPNAVVIKKVAKTVVHKIFLQVKCLKSNFALR